MSGLRSTLQRIGSMGAMAEGFIAEHGTEYAFRPLPKKYRPGPDRHCFMNAAQLALAHRGLTYVEGFGTSETLCGVPALHAWCIDARGLVVDPTWDDPTGTLLGVPITDALLRAELMRTKHWGVLFAGGVKFNERFVRQWKREAVTA